MGFWDVISDIVEAATPWSVAEAEAATEAVQEEVVEETKTETSEESTESEATEATEEEAEEEEEEEEDEEEIVDPKDVLEEECRNSKQCAPAKHHYDECVERVTGASEGGAKEDCIEEFFHLAHCATACAAPKLWSKLR